MGTMIDFRPITTGDRALYESRLSDGYVRGSEYSFANLFIWGDQRMAVYDDQLLLFSRFGQFTCYPWPIGRGDKRAAVDVLISDARSKGIPCRLTGLDARAARELDGLYPGRCQIESDAGLYDYVYDIDELAGLSGKKYHGKRNHIHRFTDMYPHYAVEPLTEENLPLAAEMIDGWFRDKQSEAPDGDYEPERSAIKKAFENYNSLGMDGLILHSGRTALAVTLGSRLTGESFDVQFEKASADAEGAYTMINCEFAKYIREKYPDIRYLDREEDMGMDGLRRAKQSYHPHHMIEKFSAVIAEG